MLSNLFAPIIALWTDLTTKVEQEVDRLKADAVNAVTNAESGLTAEAQSIAAQMSALADRLKALLP